MFYIFMVCALPVSVAKKSNHNALESMQLQVCIRPVGRNIKIRRVNAIRSGATEICMHMCFTYWIGLN